MTNRIFIAIPIILMGCSSIPMEETANSTPDVRAAIETSQEHLKLAGGHLNKAQTILAPVAATQPIVRTAVAEITEAQAEFALVEKNNEISLVNLQAIDMQTETRENKIKVLTKEVKTITEKYADLHDNHRYIGWYLWNWIVGSFWTLLVIGILTLLGAGYLNLKSEFFTTPFVVLFGIVKTIFTGVVRLFKKKA